MRAGSVVARGAKRVLLHAAEEEADCDEGDDHDNRRRPTPDPDDRHRCERAAVMSVPKRQSTTGARRAELSSGQSPCQAYKPPMTAAAKPPKNPIRALTAFLAITPRSVVRFERSGARGRATRNRWQVSELRER